ncbi:nUDIX hydrolase [Mycoplasma sp. CAG:776]|mgnify:CR=1 FL=1|nr:nUDIX hydrolase [Mycoplasma sp. CAG:776]
MPGGTIEFHEKPENTLKRELLEEVGIKVKDFKLFDVDSVDFEWEFNNLLIDGHHVGIFYEVLEFENNKQSSLKVDEVNDDSLGAEFYSIKELNKVDLSLISLLELEKMGYKLK